MNVLLAVAAFLSGFAMTGAPLVLWDAWRRREHR